MFEKMKDYIGNQDLSVRRNGDEVFIICESDHEIKEFIQKYMGVVIDERA